MPDEQPVGGLVLLKPSIADLAAILYYTGRLVANIGLLMLIPLITAVLFAEWPIALDFAIGMGATLIFGGILSLVAGRPEGLNWPQGMATVALTWLLAAVLGALPLYLSGQFGSYLDALFDSMSGFTTTGLALIQDLDHTSNGINMWRHLMQFIGGQGIVVVALTFLLRMPGGRGGFQIYAGEAREERFLPRLAHTAAFIWYISFAYLIIGTLVLAAVMMIEGMPSVRSFLHGLWIFMAAWDTGGFAPQTQSILYYHSALVETVTVFLMVGGAINFAVHHAIWNGQRREIIKNLETATLFVSISVLSAVAFVGLRGSDTYGAFSEMLRKGLYQMVSAHTGTGYTTIYSAQFEGWGSLALLAVVVAMALGGSVSSTTGAIKMIRVGISLKAANAEIRRVMQPPKAVLITKFHHLREQLVTERLIRNSLLIILLYLGAYVLGAAVGMAFGYPFDLALFESTSAAGNVGLSAGITQPGMPLALKFMYILEMWLGRLEFISVFVLLGLLIAWIWGR